MKITRKGQVTLPKGIRSHFGLEPGTEVEFVAEEGKVVLKRRNREVNAAEEWLAQATGVARGKVTTREVMEQTRGED